MVSKIACNTVKPRRFVVVAAGEEKEFLAPLAVGKIPGAGHVPHLEVPEVFNRELLKFLKADMPAAGSR